MSTISVHLYDNMTEPAGDDSFDRMCIDCLSSDDLVTEADADLSRWDYLTRTFDNDGFFMDCDMLVQQQQGRVLLLVTDNAIEEVEKEDLEPLPWDVGSVVALEHGTRGTSIQASLQSASKGFPTLSVPASASHKESDDDIPHMMCKPLSAYNYFFRVERDNIVLGMKENDILPPPNCDFSPQKRRLLLHQRWYVSRKMSYLLWG